ncbi:MAG TPA: hypothetical protein VGL71_04380, partial [Urbifossiella sp.]
MPSSEDDLEEAPRRKPRRKSNDEYEPIKKKKRKKKGPSKWMMVGSALGIALAVVVTAAKVWRVQWAAGLLQKQDRGQIVDKTPSNAKPVFTEWTRVDAPDDLFTVYFPPGGTEPPKLDDRPGNDRNPHTRTWTYF